MVTKGDTTAPAQPPDNPAKLRRRHRRTLAQYRAALLGGCTTLPIVRVRDHLVSKIQAELGGADELSTVETSYIEAFADIKICLDRLRVPLLLDEQTDLTGLATGLASTVNAMLKVGSRLGTKRRSRDVTPTFGDLWRADIARQREEDAKAEQRRREAVG